jgi:thermitase
MLLKRGKRLLFGVFVVAVFIFIGVFSAGVVSAAWYDGFLDFFNGITGNAIITDPTYSGNVKGSSGTSDWVILNDPSSSSWDANTCSLVGKYVIYDDDCGGSLNSDKCFYVGGSQAPLFSPGECWIWSDGDDLLSPSEGCSGTGYQIWESKTECELSGCTPDTCNDLGYSCGSWDDDCGGTLNCGGCLSGQNCSVGQCVDVAPNLYCGDGICNGNETSATCPLDCPVVTTCGDGICDENEGRDNCVPDCGDWSKCTSLTGGNCNTYCASRGLEASNSCVSSRGQIACMELWGNGGCGDDLGSSTHACLDIDVTHSAEWRCCCLAPDVILPEIENVSISLATLKDSYAVGDKIELTDPPEVLETDGLTELNEEEFPRYVPGEIIIKYRENPETEENNFIETAILRKPKIESKFDSVNKLNKKYKAKKFKKILGGERFKNIEKIRVDDEKIDDAIIDYLNDSNIEHAQLNYIYRTFFAPDDPLYGEQWAHINTFTEQAWDVERGDSDVVIAVVDTGVDYGHEDLQGNMLGNCSLGCPGGKGFDFVDIDIIEYEKWLIDTNEGTLPYYVFDDNEDYVLPDSNPIDVNGHGTHVAGIAAGKANNLKGISGVCPECSIMPIKAGFSIGIRDQYNQIRTVGLFESEDWIEGVKYAADNGADIISMSFGGYCPRNIDLWSIPWLEQEAINYASDKGSILVGAAGNSNSFSRHCPSDYDGVISVAATSILNHRAYYSNYGDFVDISAPGGDRYRDNKILSTIPNDEYEYYQGTSMAAPYVSGSLGLALSRFPEMSKEEIELQLLSTTFQPYVPSSLIPPGAGIVNNEDLITSNGVSLKISDFHLRGLDLQGKIPSSGDEIVLVVFLENYYGELNGVDATLSSEDSYVEVLDNYDLNFSGVFLNKEYSFGEIAGGQTKFGFFGIKIDESVPAPYEIVMNLKVTTAENKSKDLVFSVYVPFESYEGWPVSLGMENIVVDDLNNDGFSEIFTLIREGVKVYSHDGELISTIVPDLDPNLDPLIGSFSFLDLATGDIDDDNNREILFLETSFGPPYYKFISKVHAYNLDGSMVGGWPVSIPSEELQNTASFSISDLDNNGKDEVVVISRDGQLHIFDGLGGYFDGGPFAFNKTVPLFPTIGDLDGVEGEEIIFYIGDDFSNDGFDKALIYAVKPDGSVVEGFPFEIGEDRHPKYLPWSEIFLADLDGNGSKEIIFVSDLKKVYILSSDGSLFGSFVLPWNDYLGKYNFAVGDLDLNGNLEFIVSGVSEKVYALDIEGNLIDGWPGYVRPNYEKQIYYDNKINSVGDVDGDSIPEVIVNALSGTYIFNSTGDSMIHSSPIEVYDNGKIITGDSFLEDIDSDGDIELIVGGNAFDFNGRSESVQWRKDPKGDVGNKGCYGCNNDGKKMRPQSKIVNEGNSNLSGNLIIKLQREVNGIWVDDQMVVDKQVVIPPNGLLKLDIGKDSFGNQMFSGFNNLNVTANKTGNYRIDVRLEKGGRMISSRWEFKIL